jgi:hypothetical protein
MKITVSKQHLLTKLHENRAKHREVFEDALDGYFKACTEMLQAQLQRARDRKKPDLYMPYSIPKDHTADYDRVIGMLGMHTGTEFTLEEREYACYVDDNWSWTGEWRASASSYSMSNSGKFAEVYGEVSEE